MKRWNIKIVILLSLFAVACSSAEEKANKIFVEATESIKSGQSLEGNDIIAAIGAYENASFLLNKIINNYSSTNLAVKIASGEMKIKNVTLDDLDNTIIPMLKDYIIYSQNPLILALDVASKMSDEEKKCSLMGEVAERYIELKEWSHASELLKKIDCTKDNYRLTLNYLQLKANDEGGLKISEYNNAVENYVNDETEAANIFGIYRKTASFYLKLNEISQAKIYAEKALAYVKNIQTINLYSYDYFVLPSIFYKLEEEEKAVQIISKIKSDLKGFDKKSIAKQIAEIWATIGKYQAALNEISFISDTFYRNLELRSIGLGLIKAGAYEEAIKCANDISTDYKSMKIDLLVAIVASHADEGRLTNAKSTIQLIKNEIGTADKEWSYDNYARLSNIYTELEETEEARDFALKSYNRFFSKNPKVYSYPGDFVIALVNTNNIPRAVKVLEGISTNAADGELSVMFRVEIIQGFASVKQYYKASELLLRINDEPFFRFWAGTLVLMEAYKVKEELTPIDLGALKQVSLILGQN